jgi:hypothetical protein
MKAKYEKRGGAIWICPKGPSETLRGRHMDGRKNTLQKTNGLVWKPAIYKRRHLNRREKEWFLTGKNAARFLCRKLEELGMDNTYRSKGYSQFALFAQFGGSFRRAELNKAGESVVRRRSRGPVLLCSIVLCNDGKWHHWRQEDFRMARRRKKTSDPGLQPFKF